MLKPILDVLALSIFLGPPAFIMYGVNFMPDFFDHKIAFTLSLSIWVFVLLPMLIGWFVYRIVQLTKKYPILRTNYDLRKSKPFLVVRMVGIAIALYVGFRAIFGRHF